MVRLVHQLGKLNAEKEVESAEFMLTNKRGGYLHLSTGQNKSRFSGYHFFRQSAVGASSQVEWLLYKTIESISLLSEQGSLPVTEIRNNLHNIERISGNARETFTVPHDDALLYQVDNFTGSIRLQLDCRKIYDFDDKGRSYKVAADDGKIIIEYSKFTGHDFKEKQYSIYAVIMGAGKFTSPDSWEKRFYPSDAARNSVPHELYIYNAVDIQCNGNLNLCLAFATNQEEAIQKATYLHAHLENECKKAMQYISGICLPKYELPQAAYSMANACAISSIDMLTMDIYENYGIFAGLPWFYQFWTRDEAISLGALISEQKYHDVKRIIHRQLKYLTHDGRIISRFPRSQLASADGVGWTFKRLGDLLQVLKEKKLIHHFFSDKELLYYKDKLEFSIKSIMENYDDRGLIANGPLETWMDTAVGNDTREGKRIEIQCLFLNMLSLAQVFSILTKDKEKENFYANLEKIFSDRTKQLFYDGEKLHDGIGDTTQRPNIFLACYAYPKLLRDMQWIKCIRYALDRLWLDWGGLATIDRNSSLFCRNYTGENNQSYHRGDSWFFVNNLAALVMHRLSRRKFSKEIVSIINASTTELLFMGTVGHHAEVSSASGLKSEGCYAQAWSAATFIELMHEISTPL